MSELDEAERALLALASDAHDPTDADRARVRAALAARLGAAAGLGVGAAIGAAATAKAATAGATGVATTVKAMAAGASGLGSTGTASAVVTGGALATKLVVAVAITATVGVGATVSLVRHASHRPAPAAKSEVHNRRTAMAAPHAVQAMRQPQGEAPAVEAPVAEPAPAPDRPAAAPARTVTAAPAPASAGQLPAPPPLPSVRVAEVPAPIAPPVPLAAAPEAPRPAARIEAPPATVSDHRSPPATVSRGQACGPAGADLETRRPGFTVADETRLVHDGVRALHEGQPACALSLLDTHAHFYPHGVLAEERDAERALALADLGRIAEARGVAAAFLRAHPTSPLGVRLRQRIPGLDAINHDMTGGATRP